MSSCLWTVPLLGGIGSVLFILLNRVCISRRLEGQRQGELWLVPAFVRRRLCCDCCCSVFCCCCRRTSECALNVFECMIIALLTALLNYPFTPLLRNSPTQAIRALVAQCPSHLALLYGLCESSQPAHSTGMGLLEACLGLLKHTWLLIAAAVRTLEAACIFGAAIPSGVGNAVMLIDSWKHGSNQQMFHFEPGKVAVVGAVAMLAGFRRMTVSLVVIMVEMTGDYTFIVPFMCAVLTAKLVGDSLYPSVYDCVAQTCGFSIIREQPDMRIGMCVADLAVRLTADDLIDASKLSPMQPLIASSRRRYVLSEQGARDGSPADSGVGGVSLSSPLLLLFKTSKASVHHVIGVVNRKKLRDWLAVQDTSASFCGFATAALDLQSLSQNGGSVIDGSELVSSKFGVLATHAPLLTAYCVFTQTPQLECCICVDEREPGVFSVLARDDFFHALTDGHFPLACHNDLEGATLAGRQLGSAGLEQIVREVRAELSELSPRAARYMWPGRAAADSPGSPVDTFNSQVQPSSRRAGGSRGQRPSLRWSSSGGPTSVGEVELQTFHLPP
eukprot:TRINITY_DN12273_c0_g1_i1.p1 TRINITY_DN12273_c0_g1~~TRINITY_DN12273_c0_g1_i1.p1  ORF type:complete len:559 (-),score=78.11 TRINITY_DN12273_c0_g1_i1:843-2519(-)